MNSAGSIVAVALLVPTCWAAARTRSRGMRPTLRAVAALIIVLMLWNLATRGGLHAV